MSDLSSRNYLAILYRAWEGFVQETNLNPQIIRPEITRSWMRCKNTQLNPYDKYYCEVLHHDELCAKLESRRDLIRIAGLFMRMLIEICSEDLIVLSDEEGYILELLGKAEVTTMVKKLGVVKGANLSESVAGTNTAGTVLFDKKPLEVMAHEHYYRVFHGWTCSAAPIFDPAGKLIGVLNISRKHSKVHRNNLGMVVSAARAIGSQLELEKVYDELNQAHYLNKTVMESISEGLVTLNHQGEITWINAAACRLLGLEPAKNIGRPLHEVCILLPHLQKLVHNGLFSDQVIVSENIRRGPFSFTMSTQPIKNNNDQILGAVSTLREIQPVHTVITNIGGARFTFDNLIGVSESFLATVSLARKASASSSTVLLQGESGTGKELFAQAIHSGSKRACGPFIAVNCATIPRELIESELFGYEDGAFTGAKRGGHPGKFELASGGTIFLDEIGDMPVDLQVSLLRFLQERQVTRLGGRKIIPVDVRIIAATHWDLREEIAKGRFREDLFYRLYIISIKIPPLRERQGDVPLLADHFVRKISPHLGKKLVEISQEAMKSIMEYTWPGNVRELENALERAINIAPDHRILLENLPETLVSSNKISPLPNQATDLLSLEEIERIAIIKTIQNLKGNITQAARILGVSRHTLYNKIKQYGLKV